MADFLAIEWLDAVHRHYIDLSNLPSAIPPRLPAMVGAALQLYGLSDRSEIAVLVRVWADRADNAVLGATTAAQVHATVRDLTEAGFLAEVFRGPCPEEDDHLVGCEELVLEFQLPESE